MNLFRIMSLMSIGLLSISAQAALHDRGNGMIYDDVLDITWLQDANYAYTSGYDNDNKMDWFEARAWAAQLEYGGYNDWRLPSAKLIDASNPCGANDGSCDLGYNNTTSEIGHMYYTNLANDGRYDTADNLQLTIGTTNSNFTDGSSGNTVSILNLQQGFYWLDEEFECFTFSAWLFNADDGLQYHFIKNYSYHSWAVRDGDVSAVPVPAAVWMFGSALIGLAGVKRRYCQHPSD